jgi:hypothetical protein
LRDNEQEAIQTDATKQVNPKDVSGEKCIRMSIASISVARCLLRIRDFWKDCLVWLCDRKLSGSEMD